MGGRPGEAGGVEVLLLSPASSAEGESTERQTRHKISTLALWLRFQRVRTFVKVVLRLQCENV